MPRGLAMSPPLIDRSARPAASHVSRPLACCCAPLAARVGHCDWLPARRHWTPRSEECSKLPRRGRESESETGSGSGRCDDSPMGAGWLAPRSRICKTELPVLCCCRCAAGSPFFPSVPPRPDTKHDDIVGAFKGFTMRDDISVILITQTVRHTRTRTRSGWAAGRHDATTQRTARGSMCWVRRHMVSRV